MKTRVNGSRFDSSRVEEAYRAACARKTDISEHLPTLRAYGAECKRITEFGVRDGMSTIALLAAAPNRLHCYDINFCEIVKTIAGIADGGDTEFRFFQEDVLTSEIEETDLLFIDTLHDYAQLQRELSRHTAKVTRYIILHDTMTFGLYSEKGRQLPGLLAAIYEFLDDHREWQLRRLFPNNNGLAILERSELNGKVSILRSERDISQRDFLPQRERRLSEPPAIGLVIGTFASIPYIHLHLEARRRLYPRVPTLIHDDGSRKRTQLMELCEEYQVEFECNERNLGHANGDLSVYVGGLVWAKEKGLDLLVKMSRRFVPLKDWIPDISRIATETQHVVYSAWCRSEGHGFMTNCVGMAVDAWNEAGAPGKIADQIAAHDWCCVEAFMHRLSRSVGSGYSPQTRHYDRTVGARPEEISGYAVWPFIGFDSSKRSAQRLWHRAVSPAEYQAQAREWGLNYSVADFETFTDT